MCVAVKRFPSREFSGAVKEHPRGYTHCERDRRVEKKLREVKLLESHDLHVTDLPHLALVASDFSGSARAEV
jgi:hypothetical protein